MEKFIITPKVDEAQEFIEIANDFSNPLDIVREAISNSFDANAKNIEISFDVIKEAGEDILCIKIIDDGNGMDKNGLAAFFDLGNSLSRGSSDKIGEKGHGTKVYFNSASVEVRTSNGGFIYDAIMKNPIKTLYDRKIPNVEVIKDNNPKKWKGTEVTIKGYNNNRRDKFTQEQLKDYVYWFTKFGSVELFFIKTNKDIKLKLKGLNVDKPEHLSFGHTFPKENSNHNKLWDKHGIDAPDYFCKRILKQGQLKNFPEITYDAVFSIEGNRVKMDNNPMIRRRGVGVEGSYQVQERYGVWICKDYIPIQRKNEWIIYKGNEYYKFHAFFNCQGTRLTANRGSIENTPTEVLEDIRSEVKKIYDEIVSSNDWTLISWLEQEAEGYKSSEKEKKEFELRINRVLKTNIAQYKNQVLVEPTSEIGVFTLFMQLSITNPLLFPFQILDYNTNTGIDVIVKGDKTQPISSSKLFYVEFKNILSHDRTFNHCFANIHSIVCWDTQLKHQDVIKDFNNDERQLLISQPQKKGDYTKYFLDNPNRGFKIEVFVLQDYLEQKLNIKFRPRTSTDII